MNKKDLNKLQNHFDSGIKDSYQVSRRYKVNDRATLTGIPVTNGPIDLWAIMEFVKPNYFGRNYYSFMNYYGLLVFV